MTNPPIIRKFTNDDGTLIKEYEYFFIENQYLETKDIVEKFYKTFNKTISPSYVRECLKNLNVFHKLRSPAKKIGDILVKNKNKKKNKELFIKVGGHEYRNYSRYVYETYYNTKIPDDCVIFHLDLDVFNNKPDNLRLLPKKYHTYVNRFWKDKVSPEDWKLFLLMLELRCTVNKKAEELKLRRIKGARL